MLAERALAFLDLQVAAALGDNNRLPETWKELSNILVRAKGLCEFDADKLVTMIRTLGQVAKDDKAYTLLVEQAAEFVKDRKGDAEAARLLLKRANELGADEHLECIRILGKAAPKLAKSEYSQHFFEALATLGRAYGAAGLPWAARGVSPMAAALAFSEAEVKGELDPRILVVVERWAWTAIELRYVPDALCAITVLDALAGQIALTNAGREVLLKRRTDLDIAFAAQLVNCDGVELETLSQLPPALERADLFDAWMALLYALGYESMIRDSGLYGEDTPEEVNRLFSVLSSSLPLQWGEGPLITHVDGNGGQTAQCRVLGLVVKVQASGSTTSVLVAEAILASMEAFFATALEHDIYPHTEVFEIEVIESSEANAVPKLSVDNDGLRATLSWPSGKSPGNYSFQSDAVAALAELSACVLERACHTQDPSDVSRQLFQDEVVLDRIVIVAQASNSYNRLVGRLISRLSDFTSPDDSSFKPAGKPTLNVPHGWDPPKPQGSPPAHQALNVSSVVDVHLWDKAGWRGILFGIRNGVPLLALAFEDCNAGDKIIARWRERFGARDRHETIYVAVVTGVSDAEPANYTVLITSRVDPSRDNATGGTTMYLGRHLTMTPRTSVNLDAFLRTYEAVGIYELATAKMDGKTAEPVIGRGILKRHLSVRRLQEIEPDDPEAMLRLRA